MQLVILTLLSSLGVAWSAICGNSHFGGCDKSRGLCWEAANSGRATTIFCTCKAGYTFRLPSTRKGECRDIDECKTGAHSCDTVHGRCVNTYGSHHCTCNRGYVLDFTKTKCLSEHLIDGRCNAFRGKRSVDENDDDYPKSREDSLKDNLLKYFMRNDDDAEKAIFSIGRHWPHFFHAPTCTCETGFRTCRSGLCQDINECRERTSKCDWAHGKCHNSIGGYFCSCRAGYLLGPCGYKCYKPGQRPATCTSTNLMATSLVRSDSNGFNDEATRALINDVNTEKAYILGVSNRAHQTLQTKKCIGSGSTTQKFDVNRDGRTDVIIHLTCVKGLYQVKSTFEKEAKWEPWTCWTECKATCHGGIQTRTRYCKNGLVGEGSCKGAATEYKTCYRGKRCALRVRRDASALTTSQKADLIQAFKKYKEDTSTNGFWAAAGTHVFPHQCVNDETGNPGSCCYHGARLNFAMWHRAELLNIEEGLSRYLKDKTIGLPYWNWLKEDTAPPLVWSKLLNGKPNPFASVVIRYDLVPRGILQRSNVADVNDIRAARTTYLGTTMKLMESHTLHEFSEELENAHNRIHSAACKSDTDGCVYAMSDLTYAAYDPLFFMHHANVDRQISRMQDEMARKGETAWTRQSALEPQESIYRFNEPYDPFRNKTLSEFKKMHAVSSMQDLFYYKELLGYKYDTLQMHGAVKTVKGDEEVEGSEDTEKEHLAQSTDSVNIIQYQRSVNTNVKITYYVESEIHDVPAIGVCSQLAENDTRFVGSNLILGSKMERPWTARQPFLLPMATWIRKHWQSATTNYKIRACYTHHRHCMRRCPGISSVVEKKIPSPQLMFYPKNIREDLIKFEWDKKIRMPSWTIDIKSATQWIYFWGAESHNIVQVPNRSFFDKCNTAGSHIVSCTGSCILPTGNHYFIHKDKGLCGKGLKLAIHSSL